MSGRAKYRTLYFKIAKIAYLFFSVLSRIGYLGKGLHYLQILVRFYEASREKTSAFGGHLGVF